MVGNQVLRLLLYDGHISKADWAWTRSDILYDLQDFFLPDKNLQDSLKKYSTLCSVEERLICKMCVLVSRLRFFCMHILREQR